MNLLAQVAICMLTMKAPLSSHDIAFAKAPVKARNWVCVFELSNRLQPATHLLPCQAEEV
jgi:hypothetical protein